MAKVRRLSTSISGSRFGDRHGVNYLNFDSSFFLFIFSNFFLVYLFKNTVATVTNTSGHQVRSVSFFRIAVFYFHSITTGLRVPTTTKTYCWTCELNHLVTEGRIFKNIFWIPEYIGKYQNGRIAMLEEMTIYNSFNPKTVFNSFNF